MEKGIKNRIERRIELSDTAAVYGSGLLEVFATPAMVAIMEQTAHQSVKPFLLDNQDTVGIEVNIKHVKATPVGDNVICESELIDIDGKRLTFAVSAFDSKGLIGTGIHVRYIIDPEKFMSKLV